MYGISKVFGEQLSRYYFDRTGIETVCLRIGSSFPEPKNPRMMVTWLSYDDLVEALRCSLMTPRVGHTILYGASNNEGQWWDNRKAGHLGFHPKDSSRQFKHLFPDTGVYPAADDAATLYQGGGFVLDGPQYI
jgi:uronate dehydrogenase